VCAVHHASRGRRSDPTRSDPICSARPQPVLNDLWRLDIDDDAPGSPALWTRVNRDDHAAAAAPGWRRRPSPRSKASAFTLPSGGGSGGGGSSTILLSGQSWGVDAATGREDVGVAINVSQAWVIEPTAAAEGGEEEGSDEGRGRGQH
jgi:hypothetical protein